MGCGCGVGCGHYINLSRKQIGCFFPPHVNNSGTVFTQMDTFVVCTIAIPLFVNANKTDELNISK